MVHIIRLGDNMLTFDNVCDWLKEQGFERISHNESPIQIYRGFGLVISVEHEDEVPKM